MALDFTTKYQEAKDVRAFKHKIGNLSFCVEEADFGCDALVPEQPVTLSDGILPASTRCWSTYVTFFGDTQQLSCTNADTCKKGDANFELVTCGACAPASSVESATAAAQSPSNAHVTSPTCAKPRATLTQIALSRQPPANMSTTSFRLRPVLWIVICARVIASVTCQLRPRQACAHVAYLRCNLQSVTGRTLDRQ